MFSSSSSSSNNRRLPLSILFHQPPNPLIQQQQHSTPTLSNNVSSNSSFRVNSPQNSINSNTSNILSNNTNSSIHTSTPSFSSSNSFSPSLNSLSFSSSSNTNPLKSRSRSNSNSSSVSNSGIGHDFITSPTCEDEIDNDDEKRKRTKSMATLAKQLKKISNHPSETPVDSTPIPSTESTPSNGNSQKIEESPAETIVVGLKRRVSSFLFRKSLNQDSLSGGGGSFRIPSSSPSRKSLNIISNMKPSETTAAYTSSSPQFGNSTPSDSTTPPPSIQRKNSRTRSFFSSKKKHQSMEHPQPEVSNNTNTKKKRNSSSSNVAAMCESPDTGSLFSFDIGTVDATTTSNDNVSTTDADCVSNFGGINMKSVVLEDLEHSIPEEMGNIDSMRVKFLQFISNEFVRNPNTKGLPENDYLVKLYFMDFMYDGISLKISRKLTNLLSILNQIDLLCKFLLTKFDKHSQLWREIIEDQATSLKYPYLECIVTDTIENDVQRMSQSYWLTHQRLCKFLKETYETYVKNNRIPLEQLDENQSHSTNLKKQIQLLCDMFFIDLEDQFMLFQAKNYKYIKKWIGEGVKNKTIPNQVIEIYKKDKEHNEKMQNEFKIQAEDFTTKHVIDKDWKFMKYFSNELSHHWFLTYSQVGKLVNWNSFADFSSDNLNLRISKMIGYIDQPIEKVVKSFNYDNHLQYQFKNMKWSSYNTIDDSNSLQKYPSVLMSGVYESGSLFSSRNMQLVFSSKSSFVGEELTEMQTLFKSCETVKEKSKKDIIKIKMPLLGVRILLKIDENRTRVTELRFSNLGGFLNSKIVIFNPISSKKSCLETYNSLLGVIAANEGKGMPSAQDNNLMRLWADYCTHYAGINVIEKYKSLR